MATIIEPGEREVVREVHHDHVDSSSGLGTIVSVIVVLILLALLLMYGLPLLRRGANNSAPSGTLNVNVQGLPSGDNGGTPAQ
jgi:hypothetical protein